MDAFVDLAIECLTDKELLSNVLVLRERERLTLKELLDHLEEVYRRRVFADLGYSSLFKYLVKELRYSEGAAARRISALKLSRRAPLAKKMIASGELNLAVANVAYQFTKDKAPEDTDKVLSRLVHKNHDEAKHEVLKIQEEMVKRGDNGVVKPCIKKDIHIRESSTTTRVHLSLDNETLALLDELKALQKADTNACLKSALGERIETLKAKMLSGNGSAKPKAKLKSKSKSKTKPKPKPKSSRASSLKSRYIAAHVKREVLMRASFKCEYPGCDERHFLEFDHVVPFSFGGSSKTSNMRLLCRTHNQRQGILFLGQKKMEAFLG